MKKAFEKIQTRIHETCKTSKRDPSEVTLIAVSKGQGVDAIQEAYNLGIRDFGENYVQEWLEKSPHLPKDIRWHFIGDLQSKKIKSIASHVFMVHSFCRDSQLEKWASLKQNNVSICKLLLQINIGHEKSKAGIDPDQLSGWMDKIKKAGLLMHGLMVFPPLAVQPEDNRGFFKEAKRLHNQIQTFQESPAPVLSMGVSNDYEVAIEEGATHVRIGTQLFGPRRSLRK